MSSKLNLVEELRASRAISKIQRDILTVFVKSVKRAVKEGNLPESYIGQTKVANSAIDLINRHFKHTA